jgi:hypothetical protein
MHKITAEMITPEISESIRNAIFIIPWEESDGPKITAAILNAAIEAGLVSPPCYVARDRFGNLVSTISAYTQRTEHKDILEHWKGQTD